jgi:hypothetical protein
MTSESNQDAEQQHSGGAQDVQVQHRFGSDGEVAPEESTETDLTNFGADVDTSDTDPRIDRPEATEFGVDDRAETRGRARGSGEQRNLFSSIDGDQTDLFGNQAPMRCLFGARNE